MDDHLINRKSYTDPSRILVLYNYFLTILGGSLKKIAKKITIRVPISRKVYTNASMIKL